MTMNNSIPSLNIPTSIAFFSVFVPIGPDVAPNTKADAHRVVDRYLYGDFKVLGVNYTDEEANEPSGRYRVRVQGTFYGDPESLGGSFVEQRVQYQRDRFSSGLYATSAPVFFKPSTEV